MMSKLLQEIYKILYRNNRKKRLYGKKTAMQADEWALRDETYGAMWDSVTGEIIRDQYRLINKKASQGWNVTKAREEYMLKIHESIKRHFNDQTSGANYLEPLTSTWKDDRITYNGISLIWLKFCDVPNEGCTHIAVGEGTNATNDDMNALQSEEARVSLTGDGSIQPSGAVLRVQGTFDILEETFDMTEVGIFSPNIMFARTLFDDPLEHLYGENYPSADYAIHTLST